ncbi:Melanoma-associated antigen B4 [Heterocephalus glaber]|nr:Melanoma-associated antigen B4 [Heterocephalus glaber]
MDATPPSQSHGGSSSKQEGSNTESLISDAVDSKLAALIQFLSSKYLTEEPSTMAEMKLVVTREYKEHFPVIFREATQSMQLVFGIDVKKVQPSSSFYILVPVLGLTYDGMESNAKGYPRTILLIIILGFIYLQGSSAREEAIWEALSEIGVCPGSDHIIFGEPRKFLTADLVQEQYLLCLEVPNSDPPQYNFLWGPRAHAETNEKEVLEFWGRLKATTLRAFPINDEEGSEDED